MDPFLVLSCCKSWSGSKEHLNYFHESKGDLGLFFLNNSHSAVSWEMSFEIGESKEICAIGQAAVVQRKKNTGLMHVFSMYLSNFFDI